MQAATLRLPPPLYTHGDDRADVFDWNSETTPAAVLAWRDVWNTPEVLRVRALHPETLMTKHTDSMSGAIVNWNDERKYDADTGTTRRARDHAEITGMATALETAAARLERELPPLGSVQNQGTTPAAPTI